MEPPFDFDSLSYGFKKIDLEGDADSVEGLDEEQIGPASAKSCRQHRQRRFGDVVYAGALGAVAFLVLLAVGFALGVSDEETRTLEDTARLSTATSDLTPLHAEYGCGVECWDQPLYDDMMRRYNESLIFASIDEGEVAISSHQVVESLSQIGHGGLRYEKRTLIASWRTHLIACTSAWQKVTRAVLMQAPLDSWSASYPLAKTCGEQLVYRDQFGWDDMVVVKEVGFVECGLDATGMLKMLATT
ncbi:uncharacterized protein PV07_02394 [Cladophialophora immunda]|uniref:Uncharacterized protein n=1 Tax=Cladophialophora immunda TaxID=569365 RepID=A0A0D2BDY0_9EURO|nr:uncharacterized protein PV07_02394 [Cladophialophora immunda]KIW35712.1 hypothetical protein PV07_02394 [Cladophialophora immunda]